MGAIVGGGTPEHVSALTSYGRSVGTAFQVLNDVRNLAGEETARSAGSDVRNGRATVVSSYAGEPVPRGTTDLSAADAENTRRHLVAKGALEFGETLAARLLDEARGHLDRLPSTPESEILVSLTRGVLRTHAF
jgi:geranylgeranyl pyrophosphate synthase